MVHWTLVSSPFTYSVSKRKPVITRRNISRLKKEDSDSDSSDSDRSDSDNRES